MLATFGYVARTHAVTCDARRLSVKLAWNRTTRTFSDNDCLSYTSITTAVSLPHFESQDTTMVDKGPLLTSAIIFYLSIGAAIFQVLEEPNWKQAAKHYRLQKEKILQDYPCLTKDDLEKILQIVSDAAGQGVTITGSKTFNNWNWPNAVIFAATVITTIGYGNIAPKTSAGRVFCIFYGLFGVPLCLTWISELGKFFGGRAKHFGQYLTKKGFSLRKAQFTCTAIFLLWGLLIHLVLPPFVFMSQEGWTYVEGLYFSFVTLTTIGFGDLVAGVEPKKDYPTLYRYFVEVWIYLGLAWLSLFFNWKVRMVIEAHKALKKRRKLRKLSLDELRHYKESHKAALRLRPTPNDVNIFSFLSKKQEGYNDLIKQIGTKSDQRLNASKGNTINKTKDMPRSKSSSDAPMFNGHTILSLDRSPRQKRRYSFSDRVTVAFSKSKNYLLGSDNGLLLTEDQGDREVELDQDQIYENQLDKDVEQESGSQGDCGRTGRRAWDSKEYHSLTFQNANITFIDEENFFGNNLEEEEEDDDSKAKLSITTCDENIETVSREEQSSESGGSVFTSDVSEHSHSYETLVEEYAKEDNTEP
ncbi:potassium channel subfamily K member 5a isoform X2 [Syngnathoides biaculeatus]|uniref:potassium channel subfamily K member 5a isoform X2 n=1 Tax=Syngnathoides biaculeatus TaxID=300417 RepID=UPI002ADE5146|nr:potassium channel subfamily K member 5a isoform X2 [Syngnathoides biaculeatus]